MDDTTIYILTLSPAASSSNSAGVTGEQDFCLAWPRATARSSFFCEGDMSGEACRIRRDRHEQRDSKVFQAG
jgi:hypothetical protein